MKALSIIFLCSMLINASLFSQADRENKPTEFPRLQKLSEELDLTDDQVKQLETIFLEKRELARSSKEESKEIRRQKKRERKQMKQSSREELKKILTEEQLAKLESLQKEKHKARKEKGRKVKGEMREFRRAEMHPDLLKWRIEFEPKIDNDDKLLIEELRQSKKEIRAKIKQLKESSRASDKIDRKEIKAKIKSLKDEFKPRKEDLKYLVEKYKTPVKQLFNEHEDELKSWRKDMRDIRSKHKEGMKEGRTKDSPKRDRRNFRKMFGPSMFLLLDPNSQGDIEGLRNIPQKSINLNTFPNPSNTQSTVEFDILQEGQYRLDLIDARGNLVETYFNKSLDAGKQQLDIDVSNLQGNTYHLRLSGAGGTSTKTLMLQR